MLEQANKASAEISNAEEKARIIATVYGKKTSVIFDARAICDLFAKDG